jgi:hypothetical protein
MSCGRLDNRACEWYRLVNSAIADQGVDVGIGDAEVVTIRMGAGITTGINPFLASAIAFALWPGRDWIGAGEGNQGDTGLATSTIVGWFGFPGTREAVFAS